MNKEGKFLKKLCCGVGESGYQGKLVLSIEFKTKIGHSFSLNHSQDNAAKGLLDLYELNLPAYIGAVHFHVHTTLPPGHDNPMPSDPWIRSTESRNRILNVTLASIAL